MFILTKEIKEYHKVTEQITYIQEKLTPRLDNRKTGSDQINFLSDSKTILMLKPRLLIVITHIVQL